MGYRKARELARIRQELRARLMTRRYDGAADVLRRLEMAAERDESGSLELRSEFERWRMRFELLSI